MPVELYRMSITDTSVFWTCKINTVTNNNQVFILHHSTLFYASSVALTICYWRNHHIEAEYEAECIIIIELLSVIFVIKKIPIGLKQNL